MNPQKTIAVFYQFENVVQLPTFVFCDCILKYFSKHKHFREKLTSNLWYSDHIPNIVQKAREILGLQNNSNLMYSETFEVKFIFLFARLRLEYAFKIWSVCTKSPEVKSSSTKCYKNRQKSPGIRFSLIRKQDENFWLL